MTKHTQTIEVPAKPEFKIGQAGHLAVEMLRKASTLEAEAKRLKAAAGAILPGVLPKEADNIGLFRGVAVVKVARGTSTKTDLETLKVKYPDVFAEVVTSTPYVYFRAV